MQPRQQRVLVPAVSGEADSPEKPAFLGLLLNQLPCTVPAAVVDECNGAFG